MTSIVPYHQDRRRPLFCLTGGSNQEDCPQNAAEAVVKKRASRRELAWFHAPLYHPAVVLSSRLEISPPREAPALLDPGINSVASRCADCADSRRSPRQESVLFNNLRPFPARILARIGAIDVARRDGSKARRASNEANSLRNAPFLTAPCGRVLQKSLAEISPNSVDIHKTWARSVEHPSKFGRHRPKSSRTKLAKFGRARPNFGPTTIGIVLLTPGSMGPN